MSWWSNDPRCVFSQWISFSYCILHLSHDFVTFGFASLFEFFHFEFFGCLKFQPCEELSVEQHCPLLVNMCPPPKSAQLLKLHCHKANLSIFSFFVCLFVFSQWMKSLAETCPSPPALTLLHQHTTSHSSALIQALKQTSTSSYYPPATPQRCEWWSEGKKRRDRGQRRLTRPPAWQGDVLIGLIRFLMYEI